MRLEDTAKHGTEPDDSTAGRAAAGRDLRAEWFVAVLLIVLGAALLLTNRWFNAVDDEIAIIDKAAQPISTTIGLFLSGAGEHEHPPLWDLILHGWLRLTGGEIHMLRVLPIIFYLLGAWSLAKAAKRLGGMQSQIWTAVLIALWPYGFHFGRLAAWYSFSFFLVSMLTWAYLDYGERRSVKAWSCMFVASLALVYCNYFGWALLACLALDFVLRNREAAVSALRPLFITGALLFVAYLPVTAAFLREVRVGSKTGHSLLGSLLAGTYNLYCLCVSESVAPWVWVPGVIAGAAIGVALFATLRAGPGGPRRFLLYFLLLLAALSLLGVVSTKRIMLIAAWFLLPVGVAIGSLTRHQLRQTLIASLTVIAGIGWYGIFARDLYAAPRWVEPWSKVAHEAEDAVRNGGIVIGDNPSFFFYLTYLLPSAEAAQSPFSGLLPYSVDRAGVYTPQQWLEAGRPVARTVLFTKGVHYGMDEAPIAESENWLDENCQLAGDDRFVRELGKEWKDRFSPQAAQPAWRVEVRRYTCRPENTTQREPANGSMR